MISDKWLARTFNVPLDVARIINAYRGRFLIRDKAAKLDLLLDSNMRIRQWVTGNNMCTGDATNAGDLYRHVTGVNATRSFEELFTELEISKWAFTENDLEADLYPLIQVLLISLTSVETLYDALFEASKDLGSHPGEFPEPYEIYFNLNQVTALSRLFIDIIDDFDGCKKTWDKLMKRISEQNLTGLRDIDSFIPG